MLWQLSISGVRVRRTINYIDAVVLLGGNSPAVAALDRALGGALLVATGGGSELVANLLDARKEAVNVGQGLVGTLRDRVRGFFRYDRTQRLCAAHAVIVITAFFDACGRLDLPFGLKEIRLSWRLQLSLAAGEGEPSDGADFVTGLLRSNAPLPGPGRPFEELTQELRSWFRLYSSQLQKLVQGLGVWDRLDDTEKDRTVTSLQNQLPKCAVAKYEVLYRQLALDVPEFGWWTGMQEHQATRAGMHVLHSSLSNLEELLRALPAGRTPDQRRAALARAYSATLKQPILAEQEAPLGVTFPTLEAGYIDPDFRIRTTFDGHSPASEAYWERAEVRTDLGYFLASQLTSPASTEVPLVVLGQPGAGKSLLTRILAARLPAEDFLPVRVELREVAAEDSLQDQIESAIRAATGEALPWPELARSAGDALPVVLLDGFDELLQATRVNQTNYLHQVARFQQREAEQGRPVAVLITSRTAVADRARIPAGTVILRLEPFHRGQVIAWLARWREVNEHNLNLRNLAPLTTQTVLRYPDLACQPLLLLMLAIYDADTNSLQRDSDIDEAELYERLLNMYAQREVRKDYNNAPESEIQ